MQHIKQTLNNYKGLSMHQFNHIKRNKITEWQVIGDLSEPEHDLLQYHNEAGELITVFSDGSEYKD